MLHCNIDGVDFVGVGALRPDRPQLVIGPDGFEGWDDGVDVRRDEVDRPWGSDGSFASSGNREGRIVSLSGVAITRSAEETAALGRRLLGVLARGGSGRLTVQSPGGRRFATAYLHGRPRFVVDGLDPTAAKWSLQLWCPDPRKFGDRVPLRVTGPGEAQEIFHYGNYFAAPELIVRGSLPNGYSVQGPGYTFVVGRAVTSSTPHRIDCATGLLRIGNAVQLGAITSGSGWVIAPGTAPVTHRLVPVSGTGTLETVLRDTDI